MVKTVGVMIDGVVEWHAPPAGKMDYATLCGIDPDDPKIGHEGYVDAPGGQKITCRQCNAIWRDVIALKLRGSDFDVR